MGTFAGNDRMTPYMFEKVVFVRVRNIIPSMFCMPSWSSFS